MSSTPIENRIKIIKIDYKNGGSVGSLYRKISDIFGHCNRPSATVIKSLVYTFEFTCSVKNIIPRRVRPDCSA